MKYSKTIISGFSLLLLNGCLEVEDNSNNAEIVAALNTQTAALENQQQIENSVTFQGLVVSAYDEKAVSSAQITVNVASTVILEGLSASNGEFEVTKLPANSDIEVVVSSENSEFLTRVFYLNTGDSGTNAAIKDFGLFRVSEPQIVQISVLNNKDNSAISTLEFEGYSSSGSGSTVEKYKHTSTFDTVNGVYTITLPKYITTNITANLDVDKDGEIDFIPELSNNVQGNGLYIYTANQIDTATYYVEDVAETIEVEAIDVEYRISIIDDTASSIADAQLFTSNNETELTSTYDSDKEQHVVVAPFENTAILSVPAFVVDGISYSSSEVNITEQNDGRLYVRISGTNTNNCCYTINKSTVVELVIKPRTTNSNSSELELIASSQKVDAATSGYTAFYSEALSVSESNANLTFREGFSTVKGNDSADDLILAGVTAFTGNITIPTTLSMSLNNTKLTITPNEPLALDGTYQYNVGNVEVIETSEMVNLSGDSLTFNIVNDSQVFDINDVKIDNENYTTNGVVINEVNTAGEVSNVTNNARSVAIYLPSSIQSLQTFSMRQVLVVEDNVERNSIRNYNFIDIDNDNYSYNYTRVALIQLAENETVVRDNMNISLIHSSAQADTQIAYRSSFNEYLSDNTSSVTNSITFEYAYETKLGEVSTGTITLPVQ